MPEPVSPDSLLLEWRSPRIDLQRDTRVGDREYALVEIVDERAFLGFAGEPSDELMRWALGRAAKGARRALAGAWTAEQAVGRALERQGFSPVRHSWRMTIDLDTAPEIPAWPEGIEVRTFAEGDGQIFYAVQQESFDDHWEPVHVPFEDWAHHTLEAPDFDPQLWFLALQDGEPTGFSICRVHSADPGLGVVGVLGVRRPWRRRGLGRALLLHSFEQLRARGLRRVALGVDAENLTGADRLYESVGMRVVDRFDIYEKTLA